MDSSQSATQGELFVPKVALLGAAHHLSSFENLEFLQSPLRSLRRAAIAGSELPASSSSRIMILYL